MSDALFGALGGRPLELEPGDRVVREGPANMWRGWESVGGRLWLTERRLVFRSHAIAVQGGETAWPLEQIVRAEPAMTMWIVPNGLSCVLRDGKDLRFVVTGRAEWARAIERERSLRALG